MLDKHASPFFIQIFHYSENLSHLSYLSKAVAEISKSWLDNYDIKRRIALTGFTIGYVCENIGEED